MNQITSITGTEWPDPATKAAAAISALFDGTASSEAVAAAMSTVIAALAEHHVTPDVLAMGSNVRVKAHQVALHIANIHLGRDYGRIISAIIDGDEAWTLQDSAGLYSAAGDLETAAATQVEKWNNRSDLLDGEAA